MSKTFHGKRGLVTYSKSKDIKRCLESLFKQPLKLNKTDNNTYFYTFWWFRGPDAAPVENFKHLGGRRFLIDIMELKIRKIIAYVDPFGKYYGQYIYIEADSEKPTGLYPEHTSEYIEHLRKEWGYYYEEYGIFKLSLFLKKNVTRHEYDDGHTSFMGKTISPTSQNQELRMRFLTPYNLIITSQQSSYNTNKFYNSDEYLNQLLQKDKKINQLEEEIKTLKSESQGGLYYKTPQDKRDLKVSKNIKTQSPILIGLSNIGATCFMNSAIQCLSQTIDLTNYFLDENNKNMINSLSNKNQLLSPYYLELIKLLK